MNLILELLTHIYYILIDIFYYRSFTIFTGIKNFYTKRYVGLYLKDLWFKKVHTPIAKFIIAEDSNNKIRKCLNFSSYDYIGVNMWDNEKILKLYDNDIDYSVVLMNNIKNFLGYKHVILSGTGYSTNSLHLSAIIGNGIIISDEHNHYSIVEGIKQNKKKIFKHNNIGHLDKILGGLENDPRKKYVVVEGIYSIHGHFFNMVDLMKLKKKYNFTLIVDEAHSVGCIGSSGKGSFDHFGLNVNDIDVYIGTFSKTFNAYGGFMATNDKNIYFSLLNVNESEQILPNICCHHISNVLDYIQTDEGKDTIEYVKELSNYAYDLIEQNNLVLLNERSSPVICINAGYPLTVALGVARYAYDNNLMVAIFGYPASDYLSLTVRLCICAYHTKDDIDYLVSVLKKSPDPQYQQMINNMELYTIYQNELTDMLTVINKYGIGTSNPRGTCGTLAMCKYIEHMIANKFNMDDAIILPHGKCGIKNIKEYIGVNHCNGYVAITKLSELSSTNLNACIDLTNVIKIMKPEEFKNAGKFKYIVIDLTEQHMENIVGSIFISDNKTITESLTNIKSFVFSASLPAYIYYNIGEFIGSL